MSLFRRLLAQSVETLTRIACVLALVGLVFLCISVTVPGPLPVVIAMGVGHGVGILACAFYLLAIAIDASNRERVAMVEKAPAADSQDRSDA